MDTNNTIIEFANKILALRKSLNNAEYNEQTESINDSINQYISYINECSNNHAEHIIRCVEKINNLKKQLDESHSKQQELITHSINSYKKEIEKFILQKNALKSEQSDSASLFRKSQQFEQPYDVLKMVNDNHKRAVEASKCTKPSKEERA